jgi:RNA polymerase sigma-70 factor (ECF subfamily)
MVTQAAESVTRPSLLLRIRNPHDSEAWTAFVDFYGPLVYRYCRLRGLQDADAAEVTQEVFLQVHQSIRTFEYQPERGRFRNWLGTVTRHKLYRFQKKGVAAVSSAQVLSEMDSSEAVGSVESETQWTEAFNAHLLRSALTRIRPHFTDSTWKAFVSLWLENRPASQVARELEQPVEVVYRSKSRVLQRLQAEVQQLAEDTVRFSR